MSSFASCNSRQESYALILVPSNIHDFSLNYPPPSPLPGLVRKQFGRGFNHIIQYVCVRAAEGCIVLLLFEHDPPRRPKETAAALPSVIHAHHPAKLAFVPYPLMNTMETVDKRLWIEKTCKRWNNNENLRSR